ncbi:hypothetical protein C8N36_10310 [Pelagimonas varians]|uniref:Uncharacterized protein n=1 Tax=Pelagimonas varians TaxID=696760 RepID=A0A238KH14_9RHOB|nr:hypothetical protein C8N36_10310 [Pelagimonas varians]SMX42119.1 hypothetical protein PEV8663_02420 [Pelagimonas varians]
MWDQLWMGLNGCFDVSVPALLQVQLTAALRPILSKYNV